MAADLEFTQQNWPRVCLTSWSLKLYIGHMCMYSLRGGLLVCMQNHALMASSNAHVVLPHFGCVPTYFGSSAVKTSVIWIGILLVTPFLSKGTDQVSPGQQLIHT